MRNLGTTLIYYGVYRYKGNLVVSALEQLIRFEKVFNNEKIAII